jgi:predicted SnoaL-like aldol condensation-catalyzing enzyme
MGYKLANVLSLYDHAIVDGLVVQAADKYLAREYVDHTCSDADGKARFVRTYEPLVARYSDRWMRPMRGFVDGSRAFLHSYQSFGRGQVSWVCVDVFDTDDGDLITARWHVTAPVILTRSGRSQIDGPTEIIDVARTTDNKATVVRYVEEVLVNGGWDRLDRYIDSTYAEHSPHVADGLSGLQHHFAHHRHVGTPIRYRQPSVVVGCGNFVVTFANATRGSYGYQVFDIYRLCGGVIVEHWDAATDAPGT